ncbi:hypothetical protein G114_16265 [Aeromonas diversa CDC 2478-85]|uniref:Lipoprotein n=1 Tax=Aeromonas diversa CDC 2478-85 TaxID=1268237 RepID=N9TXP8_9GAMM|nr:hypothetical protein [Aeromonas diversa]ENY70825.1 hypothetical protein G114_16265 [Aeromonas diversa CDC 2478-85]
MRISLLVVSALLVGCSPATDREADMARLLEICQQQALPNTLAAGEKSDPERLADERERIEARFADEDNRAWLETQHRDSELEQTCLEETLMRLEK